MAFYPMAQHAWSGIVLCIGADGHIELEDGRDSDCATDVGKAASETHYDHAALEMALEEFEDCGPCVDVAFLVSPFDGQRASKVDVSPFPETVLQVTSQTVLPDNNRVSSQLPLSSLTTPSPFFAPLRTISLLI